MAGTLDLIGTISWSSLVFIITIYHFFYLITNNYVTLASSSSSSSQVYAYTFISSSGYSAFFKPDILNFIIFKINLWALVLSLFLLSLFSYLGKIVLASIALYFFIKSRSLAHIKASIGVMFLPLFGGMQAINCYNASTSPLSPKYIAACSLFRCKLKNLWYSWALGGRNG